MIRIYTCMYTITQNHWNGSVNKSLSSSTIKVQFYIAKLTSFTGRGGGIPYSGLFSKILRLNLEPRKWLKIIVYCRVCGQMNLILKIKSVKFEQSAKILCVENNPLYGIKSITINFMVYWDIIIDTLTMQSRVLTRPTSSCHSSPTLHWHTCTRSTRVNQCSTKGVKRTYSSSTHSFIRSKAHLTSSFVRSAIRRRETATSSLCGVKSLAKITVDLTYVYKMRPHN